MSNVVGHTLPEALLTRLSPARAADYADRAFVICSIDDSGWAHPAMLSSRELQATDAHTMTLTTHGSSRTAQHLRSSGLVTIIVADTDGVFYIKGTAATADTHGELARFTIRVREVAEDVPTADERARITSGIRIERLDPPR